MKHIKMPVFSAKILKDYDTPMGKIKKNDIFPVQAIFFTTGKVMIEGRYYNHNDVRLYVSLK